MRYSPSQNTRLKKEGKVRYSPDGKIQSPELTVGQQALLTSIWRYESYQCCNAKCAILENGRLRVCHAIGPGYTDLENYYSIKRHVKSGYDHCPYSAIESSHKQVLDALADAPIPVAIKKWGRIRVAGWCLPVIDVG
ncbi:MAG: hypothetical protein R2778_01545 [Saprospiraceae bacterium]